MAPTFKNNYYQIYNKKNSANALVCFAPEAEGVIRSYCNTIANHIIKFNHFFLEESKSLKKPFETHLAFFKKEDKKAVKYFFSQKKPTLSDTLKNTDEWKKYKLLFEKVNQRTFFKMIIYPDSSCVEIYSMVHEEKELSQIIEDAAVKMNINIERNAKLGSIADVVTSDQSF